MTTNPAWTNGHRIRCRWHVPMEPGWHQATNTSATAADCPICRRPPTTCGCEEEGAELRECACWDEPHEERVRLCEQHLEEHIYDDDCRLCARELGMEECLPPAES